MIRGGNKKGQVTIFVIIALVIIALGLLIYFLFPKSTTTTPVLEENPNIYIQNCIQEELEETINLVGLQGGSMIPNSFKKYEGNNVEYLCYTINYYEGCVPQRAFLISHIEEELKENIKDKLESCFDSMDTDYKEKGYEVKLIKEDFKIDLLPKKILLSSKNSLTLTKEAPKVYEGFDIILNNNLYELASITNSIVDWEKEVYDVETDLFRYFNRDILISKRKLTDGTKIYILEDERDKSKFQFAVRSGVWPPGIFIPEQGEEN